MAGQGTDACVPESFISSVFCDIIIMYNDEEMKPETMRQTITEDIPVHYPGPVLKMFSDEEQ